MTHWLISVTSSIIALVAGMVFGALLWQWRTAAKLRRAMRSRQKSVPLLWDIHSVLNAMNKLAMAAERGRAVPPSLVYMLSDYMLHSALVQREDGWTDRNALESWLTAHMRVISEHRGQITLPAVTVQMHEGIHRIHANPPLRQLLWFLQKVPSIRRVQVLVLAPSIQSHMVKVRIEVEGDLLTFDDHNIPADESVTRAWRLESGVSTCELRTRFEASPA